MILRIIIVWGVIYFFCATVQWQGGGVGEWPAVTCEYPRPPPVGNLMSGVHFVCGHGRGTQSMPGHGESSDFQLPIHWHMDNMSPDHILF